MNDAGRFALTGVALAAACLIADPAWSLGLGRLSVQSALGEPLRAEVDVTSLAPEEAGTLQLKIASPDVYRAAGVDYNSALPGAQVVLQRRPDGRSVLRLTSNRAVTEPFIDVILEASWSAGRLVRAYTMLLDPPGMRPAAPAMAAAPAAPVAAAPAAPRVAITPAPARRATAPAPSVAQTPRQVQAPATDAAPAQRAAGTGTLARGASTYRVRGGDTLSRIAGRMQSGDVSLEQMLVAMFRANPDAFIDNNMNLLKAGAVLSVPSSAAAAAVADGEARQIVKAQSADFNSYRQRLAAGTGTRAAEAPSRQAQGTVRAMVDDRPAGQPAAPDRLTLSQGDVAASAPGASSAAAGQDAQARAAELARAVEQVKRAQAASAPVVATTPTSPTSAVASPAPAPASTDMAMAPSAPPAPAPAAAPTASPAPAPAPAPAAPPAPPPAADATGNQPGFLAQLLDNPLVLPGAGVLVALLIGLGLYRMRGRARKPAGETSFLESRLQPDSFFGASGGQRIDTRESTNSGNSSSMSYSLSQLDAIGDVDPVAEADVYLAYGRDLQAEEILKEALRTTPERQAVRLKLLEVYAKRRDVKGLELLATQVYSMTKGNGPDWAAAQEIGRSIDDTNPLYQPGGEPQGVMLRDGEIVEQLAASTLPASVKPSSGLGSTQEVGRKSMDLGLDLDLDLDTPDAGYTVPSLKGVEKTQPFTASAEREAASSDSLSFELPDDAQVSQSRPQPAAKATTSEFGSLDFDLSSFEAENAATRSTRPALPDFEPSSSGPASRTDFGALHSDPLERKLELADEFRQIGDLEGARDLLEEVISKADGALKAKAQGMLDSLA